MTEGSASVHVDGVCKQYLSISRLVLGERFGRPPSTALRDISFQVNRGETLGLLGPNGAGKTTLLKILATLIAPTEGTVQIDGTDVVAQPREARRRVGLVSCDERSFYWRLTGRQNLRFFAALYQLPKSEVAERIDRLLATLGLTTAADALYQGYSSGMKQKLAIARGLLPRPSLVLYDEPTRSLDPVSAHNIRSWIIEERRRSTHQTHILATNQLSEAEQLCDRLLIVSRGRIVAQGTVEELRRQWGDTDSEIHSVTYRLPVAIPDIAADPAVGLAEILTPAQEDAPGDHVLRFRALRGSPALSVILGRILRQGGTILRCDTSEATLDDIFRAVVHEAAPVRQEQFVK